MAETYTPTPFDNVAGYTAVEDGDGLDAASVRVFLEALADARAWDRANLAARAENESITGHYVFVNAFDIGNGGDVTYTTPQSLTRACDAVGVSTDAIPVMVAGAVNNLLAAGSSAYFSAPKIPDGAVITGYGVRIDPENDTLPGTNAQVQLHEIVKSTGTQNILDTKTDALTGAAYQAEHDLEKTGVSFTVNGANAYVVVVVGESGGGDTDPILITAAPWVMYTVTYPMTG